MLEKPQPLLMDGWLVICWLAWAAASIALAWPVAAALHWVFTARIPTASSGGRVTAILPFAPGTDLEPLWECLARQTLRPFRLVIAVEREEDRPAEPPLPFPVEFVVAGPATQRAQKCHNQLAALERIAEDPGDAVVFFDADILPQDWWLEKLCAPVLRGDRDVVGGYRWLLPVGANPAVNAVAWADHCWAMVPKPPGFSLLWGGSMALAPKAFPVFQKALDRGLTDDLTFAAEARRAGLRVLLRPALLVPSPIGPGGAGAVAFWIRQLRLVRIYNAPLWVFYALTVQTSLGLWILALLPGLRWLAALLACLGMVRVICHRSAARRVGIRESALQRGLQFLQGMTPLGDAWGVWCVYRSMSRGPFVWRGIKYSVDAQGRTTVGSRP